MPTKRKPIARRASGELSPEAWRWLDALFDADTAAADYYERFQLYEEVTLGIRGIRPFWPPLSRVWAEGPEPPQEWREAATWAAAHAFVDRLWRESLLAR
jgi:hypothetical protein